MIVIPTSQGCGPRFMAGFHGQREMHLAKKPNPYEMESPSAEGKRCHFAEAVITTFGF